MPLRIYNTLSQTKEPFQTVLPGKVGMYVCGPTVYSKSHIGHMVGPVIFDAIKRYLVYLGYQVTWVVNITDVDDKLIVQAGKDGTTVKELAEAVTRDYLACLEALGVDGIDKMPRATEHIGEIIALTQGLIDKGFAYASGGDVYFDVTRAPSYGKLSHRDPDDLLAGARIEPSALKRSPGDFALWKSSKPGEPSWESPWGPGRPGWHIECSAMSMKYLGDHFDIHGGGLDLVFPHHENELVQSESYTGVPFASYWLHNGLLTKEGRKISKSDPGTIVLMSDLLKAHTPDTLRVLLLSSHYRRPIDYGPSRLEEIERGLQTFYRAFECFEELTGRSFYALEAPRHKNDTIQETTLPPEIADHRQRFLEAMDDDFNTGGALGELFEIAHAVNRMAASAPPGGTPEYQAGMTALRELSQILGLFRTPPPFGSGQLVTSQKLFQSSGLVEPPQLTASQLDLLMEELEAQLSKPGGHDDEQTASQINRLLGERARLRKEKNFALADEIRNRLTALGVVLEDRPDGTRYRIEPRR